MKSIKWKDTEIVFDPKEHAYTCEGKFIPGVTSILKVIGKEALIGWAAGCASDYWYTERMLGRTDWEVMRKEAKTAHRRISKEAADIGSNVHAYAEAVLKGELLPPLETHEAKRGAEAFAKWFTEHHVECGASERLVFSKTHWFAGTCDFVGKIDGESAVADFKTSSGIYPEMRLQLAAYQAALTEEFDKPISTRWIIRFDKKTGAFEARPFRTDHERDFQAFLSALSLSRTLKQIEEEQR